MENKFYEYVIAIDSLGCIEFYKVEEDDIDELLTDLENEGKMFAVTDCGVTNDELNLKAELWESKGE